MITANALICGKKIQLIVIKIMSLGYTSSESRRKRPASISTKKNNSMKKKVSLLFLLMKVVFPTDSRLFPKELLANLVYGDQATFRSDA
ncbi:hypothetical protein [Symbiopectobacterium sp. RP]|uniref:hypothetical protein n=1 Tax=Symbiopectobacterium sp. RP TaxID=3248553 RepID=UPI003D2A40B7